MILSFSTKINSKPSYFIEKIWEGLLRNVFITDLEYIDFITQHKNRFGKNWDWFPEEHSRLNNPKIHTIREDAKDRWQSGTKIDFFINPRQKNMFRFAPVLPVVSVQKIEIIHTEYMNDIIVTIDGKRLNTSEKQQLAYNDGFETLYDFLAYFNEDFTGKLIHWTELKY